MKICTVVFVCFLATAAWAGFIAGDDSNYPRINLDGQLYQIIKTYYPDTSVPLPRGLKRSEAWEQDIRSAASNLNIAPAELDAFIQAVIDPARPLVKAPHPKLLEFELYAAGRRKIPQAQNYAMPQAWRQLLALPPAERHYTTIPVLYADYYRNGFLTLPVTVDTPKDEVQRLYRAASQQQWEQLNAITRLRQEGFADTQGCERAMIFDLAANDYRIGEWQYCFKMIQLGVELSERPLKCNRDAGDWIFSGVKMHPLIYLLCSAEPEALRRQMEHNQGLRDLVVAVGLSYQLPTVSDLALEFAPGSTVNRPLWFLHCYRLGYESLPQIAPEQQRLPDYLAILSADAADVPRLVDEYLAKYPDQTPDDLNHDPVIYGNRAELQGLAGAAMLQTGDAEGAMRRFLTGGTAEDIALLAEQILTADQLKHLVDTARAAPTAPATAAAVQAHQVLPPAAATALAEELLARRLMRENREAEAACYFTGASKLLFEQYCKLKTVGLDPTLNPETRVMALLELAALLRQQGEMLLGTGLAPDFLIYDGCMPAEAEGDTGLFYPQYSKLPRRHCRQAAVQFYRQAAALTQSDQIKSLACWAAGTLTNADSPNSGAADFNALAKLPTELGRAARQRHWLPPESELKSKFPELYRLWLTGQTTL